MKKLLIVLLSLFCCSGLFAQGIEFEKGTFSEVMAKAKEQNKLVFIDFYTTWCGPCKAVAATVFPDPAVGACYNSKFINYQIDAEKGEGVELAKKYGIKAYPSFVYLNSDGVVVSRMVGSKGTDAFIEQANNIGVFAKYGGIDKMEESYKNGVKDIAMLTDYYKYVSDSEKPNVLVKLLSAMSDEQLFDSKNRYFDNEIGYDLPLFNRLADGIVTRNSDDEEYNFYIVFPVQRLLTVFLDKAIEENDQKRINEILELKKKYMTIIPVDEDIDYIWGRGLIFTSLDLINISNDYKNASKETFKKNLEEYFPNMMVKNPVDTLVNTRDEMLKTFSEFRPALYDSFHEKYEYYNDAAFKWLDYYWKISSSDKQTRQRCAEWVKYLTEINTLNDKSAISAANLLVRLGYKKDAIKVLEKSIAANKEYDKVSKKAIENLEFALMVVNNDK